MRSVVGPGTVSADAYQAASCPVQKYGVLKISWRQRICTPCSPACSINGMCFASMACMISEMEPSPSVIPRLIWIRPDFIILGIFVKLEVRNWKLG
ncbi:MAG: hypothetical protein WAU12_12535 [Saprospiraceae bacterium]